MVKVANKKSSLKLPMKRRTKIIIKHTLVFKFPVKRLKMIKRRINNLKEENYFWDVKNKQLSDNLRDVKLANALLRKEIVEYGHLYCEAINSLNSFKIMEQDIRGTIEGYHCDDNPYPHLAVLGQGITNSKLTIDLLNTFLSLGDPNNALFRQMCHLPMNVNQNKLTEPVGRVGPRVKGLLISKPQIMLERVMVPHSNYLDSDSQETRKDKQKQNISLMSIQEEQRQDNEIPLRRISFRKIKSKLGKTKSAQGDKPTEDSHGSLNSSDLSHITVRKSSPINRMKNVVRLSHASRSMRNSLLQMNSVPLENMENSNFKETEGKLFRNSHGQMFSDDPLEGCSSRTGEQNYRSSITKSRYTRVFPPSDSSDDDLDCLPVQNHTTLCTSTLANPLLNSSVNSMNNRTYVVSKGSASDSPNDSDCDAFNSSPNAEPDSTSLPNLRDDSSQFDLSPTVDEFTDPNSISAKNRFLNGNSQRQQKKKNNTHNQLWHVNEAQSFEESGKRHRKPKNLSYPGEEDISLKKEKQSGKLSVGRKAAHGKRSVGSNSLDKQMNMSLHKNTTATRANVTGPKSSNNDKSSIPLKLRNSITHSKRSSRTIQVITERYSERNTNSNEYIQDINGVVHHHSIPVVEGFPINRTVQNRGNSETPVRSEKRKRKPKKHTFPGDKDISPKKRKVSSARFSIGKISTNGKLSIGRKSFNKEKKSLKKHVWTVTAANLKSPRSSTKTSSKPFKESLNNLVQEHSEQQKKSKRSSKQRSKQSHTTLRNSECNINCNESDKEIEDSRVRPRRNKSNISYKESPPIVEKKKYLKKNKNPR